ncbi:hypothetical protein VP01_3573g3 [Puccinia sorghi]|uniref:Uncharacterized protein n=1 Tax=Puccinia sorghi TaxID=27349 RepID=A0A0L6UV94_9BASI|nr:hypothetical protein VP01_3573g3 [Puccinia sorghi]
MDKVNNPFTCDFWNLTLEASIEPLLSQVQSGLKRSHPLPVEELVAHLRHKGLIKYITEVPGIFSGAAAEAVNKKHAETVDILMNYMKATSHNAKHCWQLHPELRPPNSSKQSYSSYPPTTQLVEVDEGNKSEVSLLLMEATTKPTVLDSGATHHLINNPDLFNPIAESNIKISTGGHSNFLNATAVVETGVTEETTKAPRDISSQVSTENSVMVKIENVDC